MQSAKDFHARLLQVSDPLSYQFTCTDCEQLYYRYEILGIDEVRNIKQQAELRPAQAHQQVCVVCARAVTIEAQNALLKLLEEPPISTQLVLVFSIGLQLLPTLLSRVADNSEVSVVESLQWQTFLAASPRDRLEQISAWDKKRKLSGEQKQAAADWLYAVKIGYFDWQRKSLPTPLLQLVASKLGTRGAGNKFLLEALALELPTK